MNDYLSKLKRILPEPSSFPAAYAFSLHKCGSSMLFAMINTVCKYAKVPCFSIPDELFSMGVLDNEWEVDKGLLELHMDGIVYIGYRYLPLYMIDDNKLTERIKNKKKVLLVRDPRDALVSEYFSFVKGSHKLPNKNPERYSELYKTFEQWSIDYYTLESAPDLKNKLERYKKYLDFENVLLLKYEEVYFNKRIYLELIFKYFDIDIDQEIIELSAKENDIRPLKEDPTTHIRKGIPGDHKEKLKPETIARLTVFFREIMRFYGYDLD